MSDELLDHLQQAVARGTPHATLAVMVQNIRAEFSRRAPIGPEDVKPLVWEKWNCGEMAWTELGLGYTIANQSRFKLEVSEGGRPLILSRHSKLEAAKAAAQADYAARILSALNTGEGE